MKRQDGRARAPAKWSEHVAHPVERLVDDAVVVGVERRLLFDVREPADMFTAHELFRAPDAFKPDAVIVCPPLAQELKLPGPPRASPHYLDRQAERKVQSPQGSLGLRNHPNQMSQSLL